MPLALVYAVPGLLLVALGVRKGLQYVGSGPRHVADFGTTRIGFGLVLLVCGVLAAFSVYPFAGDRAQRTTTVALPQSLGGLDRSAFLDPGARERMVAAARRSDLSEVDLAGYGPRPRGGQPGVVVFAARGNVPLGKLEGDPLTRFAGAQLRLATFTAEPGVRVDAGDVATRATCWDGAATGLPGAVCRFTGPTFVVELLDVRAAGVEDVARETRAAVARIVMVRG